MRCTPAVGISNGIITISSGTDIYGAEKNGWGRWLFAPASIVTSFFPAGVEWYYFFGTPITIQTIDDYAGSK